MRTVLLSCCLLAICLISTEIALRSLTSARVINENLTVYDPIYGKRFKRNLRTTRATADFEVTFSTNQLGFRGDNLSEIPLGAILVLGDSFALGYGVSDGKEFPAIIDQDLHGRYGIDVPIVNAAIGDTGTGRWLKFLRNEAQKYQPRLIILQLTETDYSDDHRERLFVLTSSGMLEEKTVLAPTFLQHLLTHLRDVPGLRNSQILALLRDLKKAVVGDDGLRTTEIPSSDMLTETIVSAILREAKQRKWPLLGLTVDIDGDRKKRLRNLFQSNDAYLVEEPGKVDRPELYHPNDPHWNERGNRTVAEIVVRWLLRHQDVWSAKELTYVVAEKADVADRRSCRQRMQLRTLKSPTDAHCPRAVGKDEAGHLDLADPRALLLRRRTGGAVDQHGESREPRLSFRLINAVHIDLRQRHGKTI